MERFNIFPISCSAKRLPYVILSKLTHETLSKKKGEIIGIMEEIDDFLDWLSDVVDHADKLDEEASEELGRFFNAFSCQEEAKKQNTMRGKSHVSTI
jgi:hypothetical protein